MAGTARVAGAYLDVRPELSADFVNELVRGFKKAFDQVEDIARKAGKSMRDDMNRQLRQGGDGLAQGVQSGWRDANGRLRNELGQFVAEAKDAGGDAGVGMADGMAGGIEGAEAGPQGAMAGIGVGLVAAAGVIGVTAGAKFMEGMQGSMEREKALDLSAARLGLLGSEQERFGKIAGDLFANAYGESIGEVGEAIDAVASSTGGFGAMSDAELTSLTAKAMDLAAVYDEDIALAIDAARSAVNNGLAPDFTTAMDQMAASVDEVPKMMRGEFLETIQEYGADFKELGLTGEQAMGAIAHAVSTTGVRNVDLIGDSFREFSDIMTEGGPDVDAALASIGLNAKQVRDDIAAGGPAAAEATSQVIRSLAGVEDATRRGELGVELFGTKFLDAGEDAIFAMDPVANSLGDVGGAAEALGTTLNDNTATWWETIKRNFTKPFTDWFDNEVNPIAREFATDFAEGGFSGLGESIRAWWPHIQTGLEAFWNEDVLPWARENGPKIVAALGEGIAWAAEAGAGLFEKVMPALGDFLVSVGEWAQNTAVPYVQEHWGEWWDAIVDSFEEGGITNRAIGALNSFMWTVGAWIVTDLLPWAGMKSLEIGNALMGWLLTEAPQAAWNAFWAIGEAGISAMAAMWNVIQIPQLGPFGPWTVSAFGKSLDVGPFGPWGPFDFPDINISNGPTSVSRGNGVRAFADGGIIPASMGPVLGLLNEAPNTPGEAIIPLDRFDDVLGGSGVQVTQNVYGADLNPSLLADLASRRLARALAVAA